MKTNRLVEITRILLYISSTTAKDLAKTFGVSTRTIYRDIDLLTSNGVPISTNRGIGGGIFITGNGRKNGSEELLIALNRMQSDRYKEVNTTLENIGALFKNKGQYSEDSFQ